GTNISSLPNEIWQIILRYTIAVPVFFDPDFVGSFVAVTSFIDGLGDWNCEKVYWEAERKRNEISRVCKSWKNYLAQFQHRFVRMNDVARGTLPPGALEHAIRISITTVSPIWKYPLDYGDLRVEIITFSRVNQVTKEMMLHIGALKHLVTICSKGIDELGVLPIPITTINASLRHLQSVRIPVSGFQSFFTSVSLISLTIDLPPGFFDNAEIPRHHLPNLQTLRVTRFRERDSSSIASSFVVPFLRQQRPRIKRLYISEGVKEEILPYEIWELCPHLEVIGISIMPGPAPPTSHAVSELVVSERRRVFGFQGQLQSSSFPLWPHLKTITLDAIWTSTFLVCPFPWVSRCQQLGIRLQDARRVSWEEYSARENLELDGVSQWIIKL
ncbi:hypothetical protein FRC20_008032, partial [Serendipita sp. 405]